VCSSDLVELLERRLAHITAPMTLSVIGCVVNGPGEARETDIGFTGGGNGTHQVYINGLSDHRLKDGNVVDHLVELVERKAAELEATEIEAAETNDADAGSEETSVQPAAAAS
jgi:(E)-4-hydroxy-3-methylbut-2-enyl-diphosphate synthase